jgi:hypothetical protein
MLASEYCLIGFLTSYNSHVALYNLPIGVLDIVQLKTKALTIFAQLYLCLV